MYSSSGFCGHVHIWTKLKWHVNVATYSIGIIICMFLCFMSWALKTEQKCL